jgi:uroporphyrinogen-III decarboxylase
MDKAALYQERKQRLEKAINLEPVDRVPIVYMGIAPAARNMGVPLKDYVADMTLARDITLDYMDRFDSFDGINMHPPTRITFLLSLLWMSEVKVPGRDLGDEALWQVHEKEVMSIEDYDYILEHGFQAFQLYHMPKVFDMVEFQECNEYMVKNLGSDIAKFRSRGYVNMSCGLTSIPLDFLCGARSFSRFAIDLYRMPDKVEKVLDSMVPDMIQLAVGLTQLSGLKRCWVGGWRASSSMWAPSLWDRFVFPYHVKIVNALWEQGITSILHFDQDWDRDIARYAEFPAKSCILNPDGMTDIRKAKEAVGDRMAIMGDVPATLFATGTPDQVYEYTEGLIRDVGPTGLILCPGCDAPVDTKHENMEAFVAAAHETRVN